MKGQYIMMRVRVSMWSLCLGLLLPLGGIVRADEPKPAIPAPLRMWHVGNSWSATLPFEAMGLPRVFYHHTHNFGPTKPEDVLVKGWIGEALKKDKAQKNLLEKGDFDVVYLGFVQLHSPLPAMDEFFDIIQKHKPGARIYLQHAWAHCGNDKQTHDEDDLDKYDADWAKKRAAIEAAVDAANKRAGKQVVFIIPLHDAVMKMRRMVKAGQFPKVTKQEQLFVSFDGKRDEHGNNQIYALGAYCAYAAIHGKSPEGMRPKFPADGNLTGKRDGNVPLDDEQNAVLQKLAWETVSKYPYAGVAK